MINSNRGVRRNALEVFDRTFAITVALRLLATFVAFVGILSTLMSLQLERAREIGVLRATGMTRRQLWGLTLLRDRPSRNKRRTDRDTDRFHPGGDSHLHNQSALFRLDIINASAGRGVWASLLGLRWQPRC